MSANNASASPLTPESLRIALARYQAATGAFVSPGITVRPGRGGGVRPGMELLLLTNSVFLFDADISGQVQKEEGKTARWLAAQYSQENCARIVAETVQRVVGKREAGEGNAA